MQMQDLNELKTKVDANIQVLKINGNEQFIMGLENNTELEYLKQKVIITPKIIDNYWYLSITTKLHKF